MLSFRKKIFQYFLIDVVSASMSASVTLVNLWAVPPGMPNSQTGQMSLMKRASDVPPLVLSLGLRPVTRRTAGHDTAEIAGWADECLPEHSVRISKTPATSAQRAFRQAMLSACAGR